MRIVVVILMIAILASMGSALFHLLRERSRSERMVKALTIRVGLSVSLFLLLMAGFYFGLFPGKL
jgi:hypothetical protein